MAISKYVPHYSRNFVSNWGIIVGNFEAYRSSWDARQLKLKRRFVSF